MASEFGLWDWGHLSRCYLLRLGGGTGHPPAASSTSYQEESFFVSCCSCGRWKKTYLFITLFISPRCPVISCRSGSPLKRDPHPPPAHLPLPLSFFFFFCIRKRFSSHPPFARFCLWYYLLAPAPQQFAEPQPPPPPIWPLLPSIDAAPPGYTDISLACSRQRPN